MNILFLPCTLDNYPPTSASKRFRCDWPAKYWPEADVYPAMRRGWADYDAYIFQKAYLTDKPREMIRHLRAQNKIIIMDMCDADWLLSDTHKTRLLDMLPLCDFAVSPTEPLRKWLATWLPARVIADRLDLEMFTERHEHRRHKPDLVWFGYNHNLPATEPFLDTIQENRLWLHLVTNDPDESKWNDLQTVWIKWSEAGEHKEIAQCDIALCPPASKYKSDNRAKTALALGLVVVKTIGELKHAITLQPYERAALAARQKNEIEQRSGLDVRQSVGEWKRLLSEWAIGLEQREEWEDHIELAGGKAMTGYINGFQVDALNYDQKRKEIT